MDALLIQIGRTTNDFRIVLLTLNTLSVSQSVCAGALWLASSSTLEIELRNDPVVK